MLKLSIGWLLIIFAFLISAELAMAQKLDSELTEDCSELKLLARDSNPPDRKMALEICKAKKEISILNEEITRLKDLRFSAPEGYSFIFEPGFAGALLGFIAVLGGGIITATLTRNQNQKQKKMFFSESLIERERHNAQILNQLGSNNHKEQITAAGTILHRIQNEWAKNHEGLGLSSEQIKIIQGAEKLEEAWFAKVLISILRIVRANDEENKKRLDHIKSGSATDDFRDKALDAMTEERLDFELQKFIADELVLTLGARDNAFDSSDISSCNQTKPAYGALSPLKLFHGQNLDWQRTSLRRVWWKGIDARGVDFYQADLTEAGLRVAHLEKAVFFEAKMDKAVLRSSNLKKANLMGATLQGAQLQDADLTDAILTGADLRAANLKGANLSGATVNDHRLKAGGFQLRLKAGLVRHSADWVPQMNLVH